MKLPFIQFFPSDYQRDTRALSLAAKGGWMDVLCMLHGSSTRGTMTLPVVGWARIMGATVDQAEAVISELEIMRVAEVAREGNGDVTISSRRMLRDGITREQTRLRVERHRRNANSNAGGNANVTGQKTEGRSQKTELIQDATHPSSSPPANDPPPASESRQLIPDPQPPPANAPILFADVMALFNATCPSMPRAQLTELRRKGIRARWLEAQRTVADPLTWFADLFAKAEASDFLSGRRAGGENRTWRCTFDWLIGPRNAPKVIEGNYENRAGDSSPRSKNSAGFA